MLLRSAILASLQFHAIEKAHSGRIAGIRKPAVLLMLSFALAFAFLDNAKE